MDYLLSPDFIAGCIAGSIGIVVTQPMDTIRIRMQVHASGSMRHHFNQAVKTEGFRGLFRGVASPTLTVGLMSAILFHSFEMSRTWVINFQNSELYHRLSTRLRNQHNRNNNNNNNNNTNDNSSNVINIYKTYNNKNNNYYNIDRPNYSAVCLAGCFSGAISCLITAPTELIKCIVQDSTNAGTATIKQEFKESFLLYKNYGLSKGVYRGLSVTIMRDIPAFGIYFSLYEFISSNFDPTKQSTMVAFGGGFVAGLVSWSCVYPIDVIKTHYQLRKLQYANLPLHRGIQHHIKERGIKSLFSGLSATVWRAGPQHAVVFVFYEYVKRKIIEMNELYDEIPSELQYA